MTEANTIASPEPSKPAPAAPQNGATAAPAVLAAASKVAGEAKAAIDARWEDIDVPRTGVKAALVPPAVSPEPKKHVPTVPPSSLDGNAGQTAVRPSKGKRVITRVGRFARGTSALFNVIAFAGLGGLAYGFADAAALQWVRATLASTDAPGQPRQVAVVAVPQVQAQPQPAPAAVGVPPAPMPPDATAASTPAPTSVPAPTSAPASTPASAAQEGALPAAKAAATPEAAPGSPPPVTEQVAAPPLMQTEIAHVAKMDNLIAPVRDAQPSLEDVTRLRDAVQSLANINQARALRDQVKNPAAKKLIDWQLMRGGYGTARETKAFLEENPNWPSRDMLVQRAEEQLFISGGSAREIKSFFDKGAPKTGIGLAALASAFLAEGDEAQAAKLAGEAWRRTDIPSTLETGFLDRFGRLLTPDDHKARLDRYLVDNTRWQNDRNDRAVVARRVLPFLSETERKKADARLNAYLRLPAADALIAALPADAASNPPDWGLAFQLAQWHRRAGRYEMAWKIVTDAPTTNTAPGSNDEWWEERRVEAYEAIKAGKTQLAYDLVKAPGELGTNAMKDHAFLAGWIALRHLADPGKAEAHFSALEASADGPQSRARAGYWLARTYEAANTKAKMKAPLERAARNVDTFYGQLARIELDPSASEIKITPPKLPTQDEAKRFNDHELVRATVLSRKANLDNTITRQLLVRLSQIMDTEAELGLVAHLAEALGDTQIAVRIAKSAVARGHNLIMASYPIHAMPTYPSLRPSPEAALMLSVARQESEFNMQTTSGAGARGLLQVMPVTAQHVCKDYRIKCDIERVGRDPAYNAMMASAYIGDRMDEFSGSYVLTIAGYNAGPGRTRQWIREFGDPRTPAITPIDWIHRIPFEETREYVQKVLSNVQIYRARLGQEKDALRLGEDLKRTAPSQKRSALGQAQ